MTIEIEAGASHNQCTKPADLTHRFQAHVTPRKCGDLRGASYYSSHVLSSDVSEALCFGVKEPGRCSCPHLGRPLQLDILLSSSQ